MKKVTTTMIILLLICSGAFASELKASDIDPSSMFEQISLVVASIVAFLAFMMGTRKLLNMMS